MQISSHLTVNAMNTSCVPQTLKTNIGNYKIGLLMPVCNQPSPSGQLRTQERHQPFRMFIASSQRTTAGTKEFNLRTVQASKAPSNARLRTPAAAAAGAVARAALAAGGLIQALRPCQLHPGALPFGQQQVHFLPQHHHSLFVINGAACISNLHESAAPCAVLYAVSPDVVKALRCKAALAIASVLCSRVDP